MGRDLAVGGSGPSACDEQIAGKEGAKKLVAQGYPEEMVTGIQTHDDDEHARPGNKWHLESESKKSNPIL
jgi:hypothetical protein